MIMFYTDGSCRKNPGPGGFGVVAMNDQEPNVIKYTYSEQCEHTTNNREELKAILHAFEIIEKENNYVWIFWIYTHFYTFHRHHCCCYFGQHHPCHLRFRQAYPQTFLWRKDKHYIRNRQRPNVQPEYIHTFRQQEKDFY